MKIKNVEINSPAYRVGIRKGDSITRINNYPILDRLSLIYAENSGKLDIVYYHKKRKHKVSVRKYIDTPLGIEVDDVIRRCSNNCLFCFEKQLPDNARSELRLRDDDYTLSYVTGSYITLTNLTEYDKHRIVTERFSPLYLSVHATDKKVRNYLLGNEKAPDILNEIEYFTSKGIEFHTQFVICPGINDGEILTKSIEDLERFFPGILSISLIPVGLTRFRYNLPHIEPVNSDEANEIIDIASKYQKIFKKKYGKRIIFASDELFIIAQREIPGKSYYENYPQYDNGVGLISSFTEEVKQIKKWKNREIHKKFLMVTGYAFKDYLKMYADLLETKFKCNIDIIAVKNDYFGNSVNVASLLTHRDILKSINRIKKSYDKVILPPRVVNEKGLFLDNHTINQLKNILKYDIILADESFKITTLRIMEI